MTGGVKGCALNCGGPFAGTQDRHFTQFWLALWSSLSLVSSLVTVATFLINTSRFQYPERPIIYISVCYAMVSIAYVIRLAVGHDAIVCDNLGDSGSRGLLRMETIGPPLCTVTFGLLYFFGMSSSLWWVVLAFTWFLAAGLKWGQEAITGYAHYFHVVAWVLPAVKSIVIVAASKIDGDPVAGVCYVGNTSLAHLRAFVLAPLCVYLLLGTSFLFAGFIALFRIRRTIKTQQQGSLMIVSGTPASRGTEKLDRLMVRIGIYSVLYTVPATVVIACYFYEHHFRDLWYRSVNCPCLGGGFAGSVDGSSDSSAYCTCLAEPVKPDQAIFLVKYLMSLVTGITSGFWVWSSKTLTSWRQFCGRCKRRQNDNSRSGLGDVRYVTARKTALRYTCTENPLTHSHV